MAPFAGNRVGTGKRLTAHHQPAADTRADDHAKDRGRPGRRTVGRLRQGEAIGIIGDRDIASEAVPKIAIERLAVQPCRVGIFSSTLSL